jgi:hypothetical protein
MIGLLTYLLPRAYTSFTRSVGILLVLMMICGFFMALGEAVPELLRMGGWEEARGSSVLVAVGKAVKYVAAWLFITGFMSSKLAFLERSGMIHLPDLEFVLAWIGTSLKDVLRISPRIKDRR